MKKLLFAVLVVLVAGFATHYANQQQPAVTSTIQPTSQEEQQQTVAQDARFKHEDKQDPTSNALSWASSFTQQSEENFDVVVKPIRDALVNSKAHQNGQSLFVSLERDATTQVHNADQARAIIKQAAADYLQLREEDDIVSVKTRQDNLGNEYYTFQQTYKDVPIHNTLLVARADPEHNLRLISGRFESNLDVDTTPLVEGKPAITTALQNLDQPPANEPTLHAEPSLQIHFDDNTKKAMLVYRSVVEYQDTSANMHIDEVLVDAHDGKLVAQYSRIYGANHYVGNRRYLNQRQPVTFYRPRPITVPLLPPPRLWPPRPGPIVLPPVIIVPPPPVVIVPHRPPVGPIRVPPIVIGPPLPAPNFPPVRPSPQRPAPNFPPIVTGPPTPPPNFPPAPGPQYPAPQVPPNFPPVVTGPQWPTPNIPNQPPVNTPPRNTAPNDSITREIYQLRAGNNCVGQPFQDINSVIPGQFLFGEDGPTASSSSAARGVFENLGTSYWYFLHMHGRNSWDDQERTITASIGAQFYVQQINRCDSGNASYMPQDGQVRDTDYISLADQARYLPDKDQLIFGGDANTPLTEALDLVAHEYGHGVTMHGSQLGSNSEGAAMNEAYSDIFAAGVEAWSRSGGSEAGNPAGGFSQTVVNSANVWRLCESCGAGFPVRYMSDPSQGKGSRHSSVYYYDHATFPAGTTDKGNAHGNGGIFTMAFYLLTMGGTHPEAGGNGVPNIPVDGLGMELALKAFYQANAFTLGPKSKLADARNLIGDAATSLWEVDNTGSSSCNNYHVSAHDAFRAVGVNSTSYRCR